MIGFSMRASSAMNAAMSSVAATAPIPSTGTELQPCLVAWTIA